MMRQQLGVERELVPGHVLSIEVLMEGKRSKASDGIVVRCSCGERQVHGSLGQYRRALNLAELNHRLYGVDAVGFPDIDDWHGTPNGYSNYSCRCDPCTWAWASFRRGDDPVDAAPVWLDDMLASMAAP